MFLQKLFQPVGIWQEKFLNNTVFSYLELILLVLLVFILLKVFQKIVLNKLKKLSQKTKNNIDNLVIDIIASLKSYFLIYLGFFLGASFLNTSPFVKGIIDTVLIFLITYQLVLASQIIVNYFIKKRNLKEKNEKAPFNFLANLMKIIIWVLGIIFILSNLGINVTSLVAGLGIGGIAAALAIQNILGDLFSSFAIYFDKPFEVGDYIVIGKYNGVVEKIGIKTTRIKSLQGEQVVIANKDLTSSRLQNFKKMEERRISFKFGLEYGTSQETLKKITNIVSKIIENTNKARLDRVHFVEFNDSSLDFEVVYYVESPEYNVYRSVHEKILLALRKKVKSLNTSFAYPTQTIHLKK